jgi:DUF4097 and DUF4098 domain-containing protein YvlB
MRPSIHVRPVGLTLCGALLAPLALGACVVRVDSNDFRTRDEKRFQVEGEGVPEINLSTFDGSVDVRGWDRDEVYVEIEKRGREKEAVDQIEVVADQKGNKIWVEARQPSGKKYALGMLTTMSRSAKLIASVPIGSNLLIHSGDGSITVERVKGRVELRTNDGNVTGLDLTGDLLARTEDGAVRMTSVDGRCDVVTGDGSITLDGRFDILRARTGDGTVTAKILPGSKVNDNWSVITGDGNAILYLPEDLNAELDAESGEGNTKIEKTLQDRVVGDIARRIIHGTLGIGGSVVRVRTVDGHILFKKLPFQLRPPQGENVER